MEKILYIVVPCYNEQEVLQTTSNVLLDKLHFLINSDKISDKSRILFVNDGSTDSTWYIIKSLYENHEHICGVNLSKNRGHQNALLAGLMIAKDHCDMAISLDADLQDDVNAIDKMIEGYYHGVDIVYGVRSKRESDTMFKRNTALLFYKFMNFLGTKTIYNHADYRLLSKRALEALSEFNEVNLFLRGLVPMLGFKHGFVYYERHKRFAGESKYPLKKMIAFAFEGITSLSIKPIRIITLIGLFIFLLSFFMLIYSLVAFFGGFSVFGWVSVITYIWLKGGLILLSIGIVGEYIAKIYLETKNRPRYIIQDVLIK